MSAANALECNSRRCVYRQSPRPWTRASGCHLRHGCSAPCAPDVSTRSTAPQTSQRNRTKTLPYRPRHIVGSRRPILPCSTTRSNQNRTRPRKRRQEVETPTCGVAEGAGGALVEGSRVREVRRQRLASALLLRSQQRISDCERKQQEDDALWLTVNRRVQV